jgi:glycosidase
MDREDSTVRHVEWSRNAAIYEVNLRQFTPQGSFAAFESHLPRLQSLGVTILWLMPVQPVGVKNRRGTLGSGYSVSDHTAVNPDFGTLEQFKHLVRAVHAAGLHVIIDWVANHTAWDHHWVADHPDWYLKDAQGEIHSYVYNAGGVGHEPEHWTDVVGLDYRQPAVWDAMIAAMKFWLMETGIDGFRCDVADLVPITFWERARAELEVIKPVFMLAESARPELHARAFDMSYDWALHDVMKKIARGEGDADDLARYVEQSIDAYPADAYRMTFTTNHDKNAWEGHDLEVFGPPFKAFAVLAATLPGMPLIYGGQESVLDRRLAFFEKDPIPWKTFALAPFYSALLRLKRERRALWNGAAGGAAEVLPTGNQRLFAFRRRSGSDGLTVVVNLSGEEQPARVDGLEVGARLSPWASRILD